MKKLMIVAAVALAAVAAQAASYQWRVGLTAVYDGNSSTKATASAVYLFNSLDYDQDDILSALNKGTSAADVQKNAVGVGTLAAGKMSTYTATTASDNAGTVDSSGSVNNFFAIFEDGKVFLMSDTTTKVLTTAGDITQITFSNYGTPSKTAALSSKTFGDAGWYSVQSVPEPFSGTLALLGMGAIALRRKMKKAKKA